MVPRAVRWSAFGHRIRWRRDRARIIVNPVDDLEAVRELGDILVRDADRRRAGWAG
jgi:hypothetical protein